MELKDFIKHTLLDIVNGVEEANKEKNRFHLNMLNHPGIKKRGQNIEFDVSIIVNESSEKNLSGGIKVVSINIGGQQKEAESNQNVHKIKFEVFVAGEE